MFLSVHGQWKGTGEDGFGSDEDCFDFVQQQSAAQQPLSLAFGALKMQHQPGGKAKVKLQTSTRDWRMLHFIIGYNRTFFPATGQGLEEVIHFAVRLDRWFFGVIDIGNNSTRQPTRSRGDDPTYMEAHGWCPRWKSSERGGRRCSGCW